VILGYDFLILTKNRSVMKKMCQYFLVTMLVICPAMSWGQKLKKQVFKNERPSFQEIYHVLKDTPQIKHGDYKKIYRAFVLKGQFNQGVPVGVWEAYAKGKLEQTIDFSTGKVTQPVERANFGRFLIKEGQMYKEVQPDEPPVFMGGSSWFYTYFGELMRYPAEARRFGVEGKVYISVTITKDGKLVDEAVESGPGSGLNEEALRVIRLIPNDWIPGKINGEAVDIRVVFPVVFQLA